MGMPRAGLTEAKLSAYKLKPRDIAGIMKTLLESRFLLSSRVLVRMSSLLFGHCDKHFNSLPHSILSLVMR